jgi:hypothetical protein
MPARREVPETVEESRVRFESYLVPQESGCINWTGHTDKYGYGILTFNRKNTKAHRHAWLLAGNVIPDGLLILHKCVKNRACCNVDHLRAGSAKDNINDAIADGTLTRGEKVNTAKLSEEDVLRIRKLYEEGVSRRILGTTFNVEYSTISRIVLRKNWTHL